MKRKDLNTLIDYVKLNHPREAIDISDSLDLLNLVLEDLRENINLNLTQLLKEKEYDEIREITNISEMVFELQTSIEEYALPLEIELDSEENIENEETTQEIKAIPDYENYLVNSSLPHNLYENFTHKKVSGFSIKGKRHEAKYWRDVLLRTCDILAEFDANKFYSLVDDPTMKGRTNNYLDYKRVETDTGVKNIKMTHLDIYVWINLSANGVKKFIRKLLKKYAIPINEFYIYLRADYTPLHQKKVDVDDEALKSVVEPDEKIGKYVRMTMREIFNQQYPFTQNELMAMQSKEWSKMTLNLDYPLLKCYVDGVSVTEQIKEGIYRRYWKEKFEINNKKYFITSQWYERSREKFNKWIADIRET